MRRSENSGDTDQRGLERGAICQIRNSNVYAECRERRRTLSGTRDSHDVMP